MAVGRTKFEHPSDRAWFNLQKENARKARNIQLDENLRKRAVIEKQRILAGLQSQSLPDDLDPLSLTIDHLPSEPAYALFGRLAARCGFDDAAVFGRAIRISFVQMIKGHHTTPIAFLAGVDAHEVIRHTPNANAHGWVLNGQQISPRAWKPRQLRVCAGCLADDVAKATRLPNQTPPLKRKVLEGGYRRIWWDLTFIDACPIHCQGLIHECPACHDGLRLDQKYPRYCQCGHDLSTELKGSVSTDEVAGDAYLLGRLGYFPAQALPVLDPLPLELAHQALYNFGFPDFVPVGPAYITRARGYAVLKAWPAHDQFDLAFYTTFSADKFRKWLSKVKKETPTFDAIRRAIEAQRNLERLKIKEEKAEQIKHKRHASMMTSKEAAHKANTDDLSVFNLVMRILKGPDAYVDDEPRYSRESVKEAKSLIQYDLLENLGVELRKANPPRNLKKERAIQAARYSKTFEPQGLIEEFYDPLDFKDLD